MHARTVCIRNYPDNAEPKAFEEPVRMCRYHPELREMFQRSWVDISSEQICPAEFIVRAEIDCHGTLTLGFVFERLDEQSAYPAPMCIRSHGDRMQLPQRLRVFDRAHPSCQFSEEHHAKRHAIGSTTIINFGTSFRGG